MQFQDLVEKHFDVLAQAMEANVSRKFYSHYPEPPSGKIYGETANEDGLKAFQSRLGQPFSGLLQEGDSHWIGEEQSPYGIELGITYPQLSVASLLENAKNAQKQWKGLTPADRAAVLIECLERASQHFFEIGYSTMHTTGQSFVMSFQASGPHAFDRALEAIAMGYSATTHFDFASEWVKPMGKSSITLHKRYHVVPKGINLTIGCSTFPVWNSFPGIFASLSTGCTVIAKTHPGSVLPLAVCIASFQKTMADLGINPHCVQLAVDSAEAPIALELAEKSEIKTIDFTGSSAIGTKIEEIAYRNGKSVFTEKAGVNSVLIDSAQNIDAVMENLAFSLCLYSGQMCTAPQNFFIPSNGISTPEGVIGYKATVEKLIEKVQALIDNEKMGPGTLGAVQNSATLERIEKAQKLQGNILVKSRAMSQPGFEHARSVTPTIIEIGVEHSDVYEREWFGPIVFVIPVDNFEHGLELMYRSIRLNGALTTAVYTTDVGKMIAAEESIIGAGCSVAFNFMGPIWVNQSASFSDFHGAGANPSGNATFTDLQFVAARFNIIGSRTLI